VRSLILSLLVILSLGGFARGAALRWRQLIAGPTPDKSVTGQMGLRLARIAREVLWHRRLREYPLSGLAHGAIFSGFLVLLAQSLMLMGRAWQPSFHLWVLGPGTVLGDAYALLKDVCVTAVLAGVAYFATQRLIVRSPRLTLSREGIAILGVIATMMVCELLYDGSAMLLARAGHAGTEGAWLTAAAGHAGNATRSSWFPMPVSTLTARGLAALPSGAWVVLGTTGYWLHLTLVLGFLVWIPRSKHLHLLAAIPNIWLAPTEPSGRLPFVAKSPEALLELVERASESGDELSAPIGLGSIQRLSWKDRLDLMSCTECGRCSEHCPAARTGKALSPKELTLALRDALYAQGSSAEAANSPGGGALLVPTHISSDVLWACTTCRACESRCPVEIKYVDKIVQMRRHLVVLQGEPAPGLERVYDALERNGNPWNLAPSDRTKWAQGLDLPTLAEAGKCDLLLWVGCAASYDERARRVARATVRLLQKAGYSLAYLGEEERCTGDTARRTGNEFLFLQLAETNVATLQGYFEQGAFSRLVTPCPHCFNTLANEYPELGTTFPVLHHTDLLLEALRGGRLAPKSSVSPQSVVYHDACYLTRYNGRAEAPRELLRAVPGIELREAPAHHHDEGTCCGAGGGQMWLEEPGERINRLRARELLASGAGRVTSACPFCLTMLRDGLAAEGSELETQDVAELLAAACEVGS